MKFRWRGNFVRGKAIDENFNKLRGIETIDSNLCL